MLVVRSSPAAYFSARAGGGVHLCGGDASSEDGSANVVEAGLLLGVDADVVAIRIWWCGLFDAGIEIEAEAGVEFAEETLGCPAVLGEEMFQARAVAIFAQAILVAENFCDGSDDGDDLIVMNESIETNGEMRIGGESAANANGEAYFALAIALADGGRETDVVNFRVGAPDGAAGDRDFEFAREIVEIAVGREQMRGFDGERRRVGEFVGSDAGERAAGDVASDVTARAFRAEPDGAESFHDFGNGFDREPVELNILADGEIGERVAVTLRNLRDGAQLIGAQQAVGQGNAHHEILSCFAFSARATDGAGAVTLRVNAPPLEIEIGPFGKDSGAALAREFLDFVEVLPGILRAFQALDLLSLRFFWLPGCRDVCCAGHDGLRVCCLEMPPKNKKPATSCDLLVSGLLKSDLWLS